MTPREALTKIQKIARADVVDMDSSLLEIEEICDELLAPPKLPPLPTRICVQCFQSFQFNELDDCPTCPKCLISQGDDEISPMTVPW